MNANGSVTPPIKLSVIVPMLNEQANLPVLLAHLLPFQTQGYEVLLADGGSQDESVGIAKSAGFSVINAPRGRARQMNAGAQLAKGDIFLFLHADTHLPSLSLKLIVTALNPDHPVRTLGKPLSEPLRSAWGRFDVRIEGGSGMLKVIAGAMNLRSRLTGIATGDQALFMTREAYRAVGGFPDQPLMEDIEISRRLKTLSQPVCLAAKVTTSGRRWEAHGVLRTMLLMWWLRFAYWMGVSPTRLAKWYRY